MSDEQVREIMTMLYQWAVQNAKTKAERRALCLALAVLRDFRVAVYLN